jgi:hypothetical protein
VLPKIVASQDSDAPEVQDVVRKLADRNPQKLRQIGMNYDIANAKGVIEISEEEKKKKEAKAKEAKEKKVKEKEDAEKDKADFELWKKQKQEREDKEKAAEIKDEKERDAKTEDEKAEAPAKSDETKKQDSTKPTADTVKEIVKETAKDEPTAAEKNVEAPELKEGPASSSSEDTKTIKPKPESDSSNDDGQDTPSTDNHPSPKASAPPIKGDSDAFPAVGAGPGGPPSAYGGDAAPQPAANAPASADNKQNPWNAVCVLGLRVYSQDPEVSIKLVKPKNASEGAVLDADGATQAGATM